MKTTFKLSSNRPVTEMVRTRIKMNRRQFYQLFALTPAVIAVFCHAGTTNDLSQSTASANAAALVQNQDFDHIDKIVSRGGGVYENVTVTKTKVDHIEIHFTCGQNVKAAAWFGGGKIAGNYDVTPESSKELAKESEGKGYFETKLLLSDLPEDLQKKFGYDPDRVKQHYQNVEAQQKASATRQKVDAERQKADAERQADKARQAEQAEQNAKAQKQLEQQRQYEKEQVGQLALKDLRLEIDPQIMSKTIETRALKQEIAGLEQEINGLNDEIRILSKARSPLVSSKTQVKNGKEKIKGSKTSQLWRLDSEISKLKDQIRKKAYELGVPVPKDI